MSDTPTDPPVAQNCQAIPSAARRGWREDLLCASRAKTVVEFAGREVPVCRMHEATYLRWGSDAEEKAIELWGWTRRPPSAGS
jgi:hypothetical protein